MLSASTARLVEDIATLGESELVQIKGEDQPVPSRRLLGIRADRHVGRAESNLVGRRWEMSAIEALLDRAIDGQGAVVVISGPAGIGKSRLTRELAAMAASRAVQNFSTFCESHTSQVPFHAVKRLFRAATGVEGLDAAGARALIDSQPRNVDPEDAALFEDLLGIADPEAPPLKIDPDARRRRLTAMVNAASLATQTPAVYVIEDAHWIDDASESMLADFLIVVPQTPLLTVVTSRPEYRGALAQVPGAQTFALSPLSDSETATLVSELLGADESVRDLGRSIAERSAGTPFFAEEIVLELAERNVLQGNPGAYLSTAEAGDVSVPATLQATISSRIDRLDPKAKRTLGAAAVIGSRFGVDLLDALGVDSVVDELLTAQLIDQVTFTRHPEYAFHQPLIRTVAYETQLKSDRADMHRRVATAIEHQSAGTPDATGALIAQHLEAAGDLQEAFDWHMRAGAWSNNRDIAAARVSWDRARQVADALPDDEPGGMAMRIAPRTALRATDWRVHAEDSDARFEELRRLCTLAGDKTSLALAMMGPMSEYAQHGDPQTASQLASEQIAMLDSIGDPALTAQAAFGAMGIKAQVGEMREVMRWAQTTIEFAEGEALPGDLVLGSPLAAAFALRGVARSWFGFPGWREDLDAGVAIAQRSEEPLTLAVTTSWKYGTGIWTGVIRADDAAVRATEDALRTLESSGDDYAVAMFKWVFASVLLWRNAAADPERGIELVRQVRETSEQQRFLGSEICVMDVYLGREWARDGDVDSGIQILRDAVRDMFDRGQLAYYIPSCSILVETLLTRGAASDFAEAEDAIARLQAAPAEGSAVRDIWVLRMQTLLAQARNDAGYRELRDRYREMATSLGFEGHTAWAAVMP